MSFFSGMWVGPGIVPVMISGLDDVDWSELRHAYGSAEEVPGLLRGISSPDADVREKALSSFYSAVHHQGDVTPTTTATVPFLLEMARTPDLPDRAAVVALLVSIGTNAVERRGELIYDCAGQICNQDLAAQLMRDQIGEFIAYASAEDHRLRRAAIPALAQIIDDAPRAVELIQDRLPREERTMLRVLLVTTMANLAVRLPEALASALAWFDSLADDASLEPETRLAALAERTRCAPEQIRPNLVPDTVALLRQIDGDPLPTAAWAGPARKRAYVEGGPPQVLDAFRLMEHSNSVYAPTTDVLRTLHAALGARALERTALLTAQFDSPEPGSRLDAVRMAGKLMTRCRADHSALIALIAAQLEDPSLELSAEAGQALFDHRALAGPARDALAGYLAAQQAAHGPEVWAAPDPRLRRAYQNALRALARLGDDRAVTPLAAALDGEVDVWRAVQVAGHLPQAAAEITPLLCRHLAGTDLATVNAFEMSTRALISAIRQLAHPASLPTILVVLEAAVDVEHWPLAADALLALAALGNAAASALPAVRALTDCPDGDVRSAIAHALAALGAGVDELMPLLLDALSDGTLPRVRAAVEVLVTLTPEVGSPATPRLRQLLAARCEWISVHAAAGLWHVAGHSEAQPVLDALLRAWEKNRRTANAVVEVLAAMGPAAAPALPQLNAALGYTDRGDNDDDPWWSSLELEEDEELRRTVSDVVARLAQS